MTDSKITEIVNKVAAGDGLTNEEATALVELTAAIDQRGVIAENVVQFVLDAAEHIYKEVAEELVNRINLRDIAKAKQVVGLGKKAAERLVAVSQIYVAHMFNQLQQSADEESAVSDSNPDIVLDENPA